MKGLKALEIHVGWLVEWRKRRRRKGRREEEFSRFVLEIAHALLPAKTGFHSIKELLNGDDTFQRFWKSDYILSRKSSIQERKERLEIVYPCFRARDAAKRVIRSRRNLEWTRTWDSHSKQKSVVEQYAYRNWRRVQNRTVARWSLSATSLKMAKTKAAS